MLSTDIRGTQCDHFIISDCDTCTVYIDDSVSKKERIYINGVSCDSSTNTKVMNLYMFDKETPLYIGHIHFNDKEDSSVIITVPDSTDEKPYDSSVLIKHRMGDDINKNRVPCTKLSNHDASFQLLRVNPKLTGNIKVVVDEDGNMYLDTFKVSNGLSQRRYRKIKINPNEYYGSSVMSQFKGLPSDDIYKIEDSCYTLFSTVNNVGDSYYDTYNSGVRTNTDKLYKENYSLLAPLCIRKNMPDFFLIFKCKDLPEFTTDKERLSYMIQNGKLIKSYDLREKSDIGKYIRTIYKKSKEYPGYMYVSYDYNEYNVYNGISLDHGVVGPHYESTSLERNIKNQVAMNDWYTLGFERNRLLAKDIVNFEYMFDDPEEKTFSLANYFGFYVKLNGEEKDFSCINITNTYGNERYEFDTELSGDGFLPENYKNVIYGFSEPNGFHRLFTNIINVNNDNLVKNYVKRPYKCIISSDVTYHNENSSHMFFRMTDVFCAGEHYRIIDKNHKKIYDVIMSNYDSMYDYSEISYDYHTVGTDEYEIRKISLYNIGYRGDDKVSLSEQLRIFVNAVNELNPDLLSAKTDGIDTVTITYNRTCEYTNTECDLLFERVLTNCTFNNTIDIDIDKSCHIMDIEPSDDDISTVAESEGLLFPFGFESLGNRKVYCTSFVPYSTNGYKMCYFKDNIDTAINTYYSIIYKYADGYNYTTANDGVNVIRKIKHDSSAGEAINSINVSSFVYGHSEFCRFFEANAFPETDDNIIRLYQNYPLNAGICSIIPVRDLYTNVLDTNSQISFNTKDGNISYDGGKFKTPNSITGKILLDGEEEYFCDYIDKNELLKNDEFILLNRSDNTLSNYIDDLVSNNINRSDISLIAPYCCKWESIGTDYTGEHMRIMYPLIDSEYTSLTDDSSSYFLSFGGTRGVGYISTSAVNGSDKCTTKYINDGLSTKEHHSFREYVTNDKGSLDDILHLDSSNVSYDTHSKWSRVYKHGNNTIEFISSGVKIQLTSSNDAIVNLTRYNGYSGILICMDGNNPLREKNIELFIDETKEQLALIYYNGTQSSDAIINNGYYYAGGDGIGDFDDDIKEYVAYRIQLNKPLTDLQIEKIEDENINIAVPNDAGLTENQMYNGAMIISSPVSNYDTYSVEKYNMVIASVDGKVCNDKNSPGYILGKNPVIISNSEEIKTSNGSIKNNLDKLVHTSDMFIVSDGNRNHYKFQTLDNIKNKSNDVAIFIKNADSTKDYSGKNSVVTVSLLEPIITNRENSDFTKISSATPVLPTHCVPIYKDVFNFAYNDVYIERISKEFNKDFRGCNIMISSDNTSINSIDQMWIKKYLFSQSENNNIMTLAKIDNFSLFRSCFENKMYRTYTGTDEYTLSDGIDTGYEKNTFYGSRALQLKTENEDNTITITDWVDTVIDENKRTIRLNITESLINYITFSEGFESNWTRFYSTETLNKAKYIKNSILKHINITSGSVFKLYVVEKSTIFKFVDYSNTYNLKEMSNSTNNIVYENDTYYIELEGFDSRLYSATFTIKI